MTKVEQFYNKNQFILRGNGEITFQSYSSIIANIKDYKITFYSDWDYSNTTRKHLYLFLNDYIWAILGEQKDAILKALESNNKRQALQELIDNGIIEYSEEY